MTEKTIALVTGANKGIGYEIAAGLAALGRSVGIGARDDERREAAVEKLRAGGADAFGVPLDVTDDASVAAAAALVEERFGRLDVLVNNAGIAGHESDPSRAERFTQIALTQMQERATTGKVKTHADVTLETTDDEWHRMIAVHLSGTFFCMAAMAAGSSAQREARRPCACAT